MSDNPFKDVIDFARLGEPIRQTLRPKKKFKRNNSYKRFKRKMKRNW